MSDKGFGFTVSSKEDYDYESGQSHGTVWTVALPHSCDSWMISESHLHADAVRNLQNFIVEAEAALRALILQQDFPAATPEEDEIQSAYREYLRGRIKFSEFESLRIKIENKGE